MGKELERLTGKKGKLEPPLVRLRELVNSPDYEAKVPADVREGNSERLRTLEAEMKRVEDAMEGIRKLSLSN